VLENQYHDRRAPISEDISGRSFSIRGRAGWGNVGINAQFIIVPDVIAAKARTIAGVVRFISSSWAECRGGVLVGIQNKMIMNRVE